MAGVQAVALYGFEWRDLRLDGWEQISGAHGYGNSAIPAESRSAWYLNPTLNGSKARVRAGVSLDELVIACNVRHGTTYQDYAFLGCELEDATQIFAITGDGNGTTYYLEIGGVQQAGSAEISEDIWHSLIFRVVLGVSGSVDVYLDGDTSTPVLSYSGAVGALGDTLKMFIKSDKFSSGYHMQLDDVVIADGSIHAPRDLTAITLLGRVATSDGHYQEMTGSHTDTDEIPPSDSDALVDSTGGLASTFGFATVTLTPTESIMGTSTSVWVLGDGAVAPNVKIRNRLDGVDYDSALLASPADDYVQEILSTSADGSALSEANLNATEIGIITIP